MTSNPILSENSFNPAESGWTERRSNPYFAAIGPFWQREEDGRFIFGVHCTPNTLNNFGVMHGGAVTAFCDQALGGTLSETLSRSQPPGAAPVRSVTVQLNVQFLAAIHPFDFVTARCGITRKTRSLVFLDGVADVNGEAVASLQSVFKLVKPDT